VRLSNAELVRRAVGDLGALFELLDSEVVWDNRSYSPIDQVGVFRGKPAVVKLATEWVGTWTEYHFAVDEIVDAGDDILVVVTESGIGKASGAPMEHHLCYLWSFHDGRIVRGASYKSKDQALAALAGSSG
jgi:ketosteroid isomerase-like protein